MLPQDGAFAIMLQETGITTRAQEMHVAAALRDKGYTPFFSSRLAGTGASPILRGGGLLTAVSSKYVAEQTVLSFTEIVPGKAAALEICTDGGGLTLTNVHGPQAGCSSWAGRAGFWADIQMYATARSLGGRHPVVIAGDTNIYMDATSNLATEHFRADWEVCSFRRATRRGTLPGPGVRNPGRGRVGPSRTLGPGRPESGALQPHRVPQGSPRPATVPPRQRCHAAHRQAAARRHVPPDGATHDAVARAPRAAPPLPQQRRPVASSGAGMPQPVRQ